MIAVAKAAGLASAQNGLFVDSLVHHPSDPLVYKIRRIDGPLAEVWISAEISSTGEEVHKTFPLNELHDVNIIIRTFKTLCMNEFVPAHETN